MLKNLHIQNYAIIDEIDIDFAASMNVITGETGAGKSILMGALSLILGDRADTSVLLNRDRKCIVEGTFIPDHTSPVNTTLADHDLKPDDDATGEIVIRREIGTNGKSRAFVNDIPVNLEQLKLVSSQLVDLHRQFDTLSLGETGFQLNVIDALANNAKVAAQYQEIYKEWKKLNEQLQLLGTEKSAFTKEYDYNKFLFDELEEASFAANELEEAEQELKLLSNSEEIKTALTAASAILKNGEQPVLQQLRNIQQLLSSYTRYHSSLEEVTTRIHSAYLELQDVGGEIERIEDEISYDAAKIELLNERLSTGYRLLKKHGVQTTAQLLGIRDELANKLEAVLNIDEKIAAAEHAAKDLQVHLEKTAAELSANRKKQVGPLEEKVNRLLAQVGMPNAKLKVAFNKKELDQTGQDDVEFMFDANKSGRFEPIRKVASGGELSRLMLSIKSLVAESMNLPTLIFDEIDTGISGEAAKQVGIIMQSLSTSRQLITITHQPQIAGKANAHLFVYKDITGNLVRTNIRTLSGEERITAIAKMLSGERPTAAALENAREMVMN